MKFALALCFLISTSAFARDRVVDCTKGDDAVGGKFCYYQLSQCNQEDCDEAADCANDEHNKFYVGDDIIMTDTLSTRTVNDLVVLKLQVVTSNMKKHERTITLEKVGNECRPVKISLKK